MPSASKKPNPPIAITVSISPRLLRRLGAAAYIAVSPATFDSYRADGLIRAVPMPAVRNGGQLRTPCFDTRDLDEFVDKLKAGDR